MSGRGLIPLAIPFIIGLVFLVATIVTFARTLVFIVGATRTEATFVGAVAKRGGNHGGTFLHPQFTFTTEDGRRIIFTSPSGSTDQPYEDGQKVLVLYDAHDPAHAEIDSIGNVWLATLLLAPFALLFTIIPAAVFVLTRRQTPVVDLQ